jgi:hypothetical protein
LNELLGGKEAGANETLACPPKAEAGMLERAPENCPPDVTEAAVSVAGKLTAPNTFSEAGQRNAYEV